MGEDIFRERHSQHRRYLLVHAASPKHGHFLGYVRPTQSSILAIGDNSFGFFLQDGFGDAQLIGKTNGRKSSESVPQRRRSRAVSTTSKTHTEQHAQVMSLNVV
jgi:hypothetical protein